MAEAKQCHVMVFPWLAFGHMLPFLELSKKLAANGIKISYISTPRNLQRLPPIPPNLATNIHLLEIPLPQAEGLRENCEATIDLQHQEIQYLKRAHDKLAAPFGKLLQDQDEVGDLPDMILMDFAQYWIPEIAAKFGVPTAFFSGFNAGLLAYVRQLDDLNQETSPPTPDFGLKMLSRVHCPDISDMSTSQRLRIIVHASQFVAIRSCKEFEEENLDLLEKLYQKPVLPIGLLPVPNLARKKTEEIMDSRWSTTFEWLDNQKSKSVLFVGFGSEYKMPIEQIHELALGIELSVLSFIWILRKPEGVEEANLLPPGFENRVSEKGIVCLSWVPQIDILAHRAIGGCLFHCGWSSTIESLSFGHPLILMPMVGDQGHNAKLLVQKGVGYEVPRGEDGSFTKEMVAESVRVVMESREGEAIRKKASQMQDVFGNQEIHDNYINSFTQHLQKFKGNLELCKSGTQ